MKATILDTKTGEKHEINGPDSPYDWIEGNWSCDCNRGKRLSMAKHCKGTKRFLVVDIEDKSWDLNQINGYYPEELKRKHLSLKN